MIKDENISIFAGCGGRAFAERLCAHMGHRLSESEVIRFSDRNSFVRVLETVRDREVYLVQPIGLSPNDEFVETLFWMDAFKRANAKSVTAIIPYFGYAKGDKKDEPRVSIRARVCAECIELSGADHIMIMDLHSPQVQGFFKKPVDHLYAMPLLCEMVKTLELTNTVVVSPDAGFAKQARRYGAYLGFPVAIGDKARNAHDESPQVLEIIGEINGHNSLIVDDFSISAGTLIELSHILKERGVQKVYVCLSHNLVSAEAVKRLEDSPIDLIISTDTVDNPNIVGSQKFKTVSVAPLFAEAIMRAYNLEPISPLFTTVPQNVLEKSLQLML